MAKEGLKVGDMFTHTAFGSTFTYKVTKVLEDGNYEAEQVFNVGVVNSQPIEEIIEEMKDKPSEKSLTKTEIMRMSKEDLMTLCKKEKLGKIETATEMRKKLLEKFGL